MDLVVVGHVTLDHAPGGIRPGGAAYYAALTAHRLGVAVGLLTAFGPDLPAATFPAGIAVVNLPARATTAFELRRGPEGRRLRLLARAPDLEASALPAGWARVPLALLCPVAGEVDPAFASCFEDAAVGVLPQGWMRARGAGGVLSPGPWEDAGLVLPHAQLVVVSEEDVGGEERPALVWFQQVPLGALTRGRRGASLFVNGERYHVAPDRAVPVDATGAGDVFAATLLVEYQRRGDPWEAAAAAACAAAASVEAPGPAAIPDRAALEARLSAYRGRRGG